MREPSLLPVFGKLGLKTRVVMAVPARPGQMADRMRQLMTSHGAMVLKLSIVVWTVVVLAAVFFIVQG
ncbi:hypothetical protein LGH82_28895 [Mesorhizobium sp. PAMC28654]|uniref:hypothetical protein n=1 Tax=Mesorhizobium sp. PAMC28654 TaxID=2880934 RepID=UPI001D0B3972|nr:hypothetical protein [Mesorhizobium sp. PAMC28654]UDL89057.1 hypothetical protein LGH82_28895 [Mesorhizobium sp. PAMC28654]